MRKLFIILLTVMFLLPGRILCQSFDWNIRGGLNLMNSKTSDKDLAYMYHLGGQAGVRISSFGFYGEVLYSIHENQDGGDPVSYIIPAIITKGYFLKLLFIEFGGSFLTMTGETDVSDNTLNPDGDILLSAGLGIHFSKLELSFRLTSKQAYGLLQGTLAVKF